MWQKSRGDGRRVEAAKKPVGSKVRGARLELQVSPIPHAQPISFSVVFPVQIPKMFQRTWKQERLSMAEVLKEPLRDPESLY